MKKAAKKTKAKAKPKKAIATKRRASPKKTAAKAKPKKTAAKAKPKPKKTAAPRKKTAAPRKKAAAPRKKAAAPRKKTAAPRKKPFEADAPSQRATDVTPQVPHERALTDEEREAMAKVAHTALAALETDGVPERIVARIATFVDEIRTGTRAEPNSQDVRLGLGVLWGEQVRAQVGWRWVHLSYPNGFASYALVPDDRAFACFPLNRLGELMKPGAEGANTSMPLFESIRVGTLPARQENAYLVIG